jgi:hypothetical protein
MRRIGNALQSLVLALWRAVCFLVWTVKLAILVACNAFWRFLLRRAENSEQALIRSLNEIIEEKRIEAEKKQIEHDRDVSQLKSELSVVTKERNLLVEVHTRNTERVRAEASVASRAIAESEHSMLMLNQNVE